MTVVFIDPIHGAALTAGLSPILPGLPCPTPNCGEVAYDLDEGWMSVKFEDCRFCNGSGVWTPPDHPVTIGVTNVAPETPVCGGVAYGDWKLYKVPWVESDRWVMEHHARGEIGAPDDIPIVLSSMIGEGTLRKLKVVEADADGHGAVVEMRPDGSLWFWPEGAFGEDAATDISSALPFLPGLKPGDTVYLLDGFTESVECPECGGRGYVGEYERHRCDRCWGSDGRVSCPFPVEDAPDHPCVIAA